MDFNMGNTFDSFRDGTKEVAEITHQKTKELHEKYVSKVLPDCGKYGDVAKFIAEMAPGVAEYNAIREGDWKEFAIAAGLDITAVGIGAATAGAGYAAVKSGSTAAKTGTKLAVKEVAEAGTKKIMKKTAGEATEKIVKETVETAAEKVAKETTEAKVGKTIREGIKEVIKSIDKKSISQIEKNRIAGALREKKVWKKLASEFGKENVFREQYIRDKFGNIIKDSVTGEARRIDFIVIKGDKIIKSIEVTSQEAQKGFQIAKEYRILEEARKIGGAFIKDSNTGKMFKIPEGIATEIRRVK